MAGWVVYIVENERGALYTGVTTSILRRLAEHDGHGGDLNGAEVVAGEPEEVDLDKLGELAALQGVVKFPVRIKCATLSWNALAQGLDEVAEAS